MDSTYKSLENRYYDAGEAHSFSAELTSYRSEDSKWAFQLWHKKTSTYAWTGTLGELIQVILAGKAALEAE